ncbi:MAG: hypothetical protein M1819_006100 [Sarea resinae]|nr:MAG: hypothetical protein M1819_006100 [Sarea resinae]
MADLAFPVQRQASYSNKQRQELDIRVEDYLNDKLQTPADLQGLDSLLLNVKHQQALLKRQLHDADSALEQAKKESKAHSTSVTQRAQEFEKQQQEIDRRLQIVTRSETSTDAVELFEASMAKLRRLDVASGYVELLKEVDVLSAESRQNVKSSPEAALTPYVRLQRLVRSLRPLQTAAEGAAPHLLDHVEATTAALRQQIKDNFSAEFEALLHKLKWPDKGVAVPESLDQEWTRRIDLLLDLQQPELETGDNEHEGQPPSAAPPILFPFEVLSKPLELRFRYHFEGDRPTNRIDKPEYFLSHIIGLLESYNGFLTRHVQPILVNHFKGSNLALNLVYIDSTSAFIHSLLPVLRSRIFSVLPQIATQPQLLSHFMHELMSFDSSLKDDWGYDVALSRYQSIIDAPESGELDHDSVDQGTTKPTKAAIRVNDLLETITDRYRPLSSFSQKLRFLIDIQIAIFDKFHERLHSSLEAYLAMTSSIARTVQGVSKEDQANLRGLGGLERLCRVYGSAAYLEKAMSDWSDDIFFLELWEELQDRARGNTGNRNLAGPMSFEDVAERTSSAVGSDSDSGALFDETAAAYKKLRVRAEGIIVDTLTYNVREALRPYSRISPWSALGPSDLTATSTTTTAELAPLLTYLTTSFSFLSSALSTAPLRRIARPVAQTLNTYMHDCVLRNLFSTAGSAQFARDVAAVCGTLDQYLGYGQAERAGMRKIREEVVLLGLPVRASGKGRGSQSGGDVDGGDEEENGEGLGAWDDDIGLSSSHAPDDKETPEGSNQSPSLGLWEVESRLFQDNESARAVLQYLGLESLSEADARHVLGRRVELTSTGV